MAISLPTLENASSPPDLSQPLAGGSTHKTAGGEFTLQRLNLRGGACEGVELLLVQSDRVRAAICPTRGMSLWKASVDGTTLGWSSPVQGPVHPNFVAIEESSGLGWLDGFDELMVRCGLRSFGAPDFDESGSLLFPLHGRIGNLPARNLQINVDEEHSLLEVQAEVYETRFLQFNLQLTAKYVFSMGQPTIGISDTVLNASATPTTMQMLYHINIGDPVLEEGSKVDVSASKVVARNAHAASDLEIWNTYPGPVAGYEEQVYFFAGKANEQGWAQAVVANAADSQGVSVRYKTDTLPFFTQWKNTVAREDGFVTGLEPGTGFPNPRSFEEEKGRVVSLGPQESVEFNIRIEGLGDARQIAAARKGIEELTGGRVAASGFDTHWCTPR
ncbi:MAG: aldose 1-epimerase family protein [Planctomycetota bacterium]|nr:aldose 1-epimerase family protein [Planctomycetota bacterium]